MKPSTSLPAMKSSGLSWSMLAFVLAALLVIVMKR
jgi:hypothetical protein